MSPLTTRAGHHCPGIHSRPSQSPAAAAPASADHLYFLGLPVQGPPSLFSLTGTHSRGGWLLPEIWVTAPLHHSSLSKCPLPKLCKPNPAELAHEHGPLCKGPKSWVPKAKARWCLFSSIMYIWLKLRHPRCTQRFVHRDVHHRAIYLYENLRTTGYTNELHASNCSIKTTLSHEKSLKLHVYGMCILLRKLYFNKN